MDANRTKFHLLLGKPDWENTALPDGRSVFSDDSPLYWDVNTFELRLRSQSYLFQPAPRDHPASLDSRRGASPDASGNVYWISENTREIRVQSSGESTPGHFWSASDAKTAERRSGVFQPAAELAALSPEAYQGLTVTEDQYLVAGVVSPPGLLVFDLLAGGPPRVLCWPIPFSPFDFAPRSGGGVWILDSAQGVYWGLDRTLRVLTRDQPEIVLDPGGEELFQPVEGEPRPHPLRTFPAGNLCDLSSPISSLRTVAIEALDDNSVLILEATSATSGRILRFRGGQLIGEYSLDYGVHDFVVVFGERSKTDKSSPRPTLLFVATRAGNQAFAYRVGDLAQPLALTPTNEYYPMRRFGGHGLIVSQGKPYYDFGDRWIPLVAQDVRRFSLEGRLDTQTRRDGELHPGFDGKEPGCVWHRLLFDAAIPAGSRLSVWSRAADDETILVQLAWDKEPAPYRRATGSELPYAPAPVGQRGTFELLLQKARGRFLQLRLEFVGDGRVTPRIHALRIYYPRFSYLERYLPAVYRDNPDSASFLDRFLTNIEGTATTIEDRIAAAQILFDVRSAPADTLPWLASWFGLVLDPAWDERRRRLLIEHAMDFFQWRGTVRGLKMALRLTFDANPDARIFDPACDHSRSAERYRIIEKFLSRTTPAVELGDPTEAASLPQAHDASASWTPEQGGDVLYTRYANAGGTQPFSLTPLDDTNAELLRQRFARTTLGVVPSDPTDEISAWKNYLQAHRAPESEIPLDQPSGESETLWRNYQTSSEAQPYGRQRRLWQQYLARRYVSVRALNQLYASNWIDFEAVSYPAALPRDPARLRDWLEFETRVLPILASAHRFSVLLPIDATASATDEYRQNQLGLANRLIELGKPAHTVFDVRFFWAMFRVGEARLGADSLLGLGGRDPAVLNQLVVLDRTYLGEASLATAHPPSLPGRIVAGRDRLRAPQSTIQKSS